MEEVLTHYGVPGMKWGVRKQENRVNTGKKKAARTPEERRAIGKRRAKIALGVIGGVAVAATVTAAVVYKKKYAPTILKTGTTLQNVNPGGHLSTKRPFYATHLSKDKKIYLEKFTEELRNGTGRTDIYASRVINKRPLKIPSVSVSEKMLRDFTGNSNATLKDFHRVSHLLSDNGGSAKFVEYVRSKGFDGLPDNLDKGYVGHGVAKSLKDGAQNPVFLFPDAENYYVIGKSLVSDILKKS